MKKMKKLIALSKDNIDKYLGDLKKNLKECNFREICQRCEKQEHIVFVSSQYLCKDCVLEIYKTD